MIGHVPRSVAAVLGVATCVAGIGLVWGAGAEAFTGTPAALALVHRIEAQTARFPAVSDTPTGWVAYCPEVPLGWINAPISGCRQHARVTEEIDLYRGRVVRYVGEVRARSQASIRSVGSPRGWFQLNQGLDCWLQFPMPFVKQSLVGYPFPGERVRIVSQSPTQVVIRAVAPRFQYHELDYVNPATDLIYRVDEFNSFGHKSYRETDHLTYLSHRSRTPATTPVCA
jgi:hypothetical protein